MALRQEVLGLYRRILRLSYKWQSASRDQATSDAERQYIRSEARRLFEKNKVISDENEIRQHLKEGETRLVLATHYENPYPRPVHLPQNVLHSPAAKRLKVQKRKLDESKPIYGKSYKDEGL